MALETLAGIEEIGGYKVVRVKPPEMSWDDFDKLRNEYPINITERMNTISFKLQNGAIKEVGRNGCQIDTILETVYLILEDFQKRLPCEENVIAIYHLDQAIHQLMLRQVRRVGLGIEGLEKEINI